LIFQYKKYNILLHFSAQNNPGGTIMDDGAIVKAKEYFGTIVPKQLNRMEHMQDPNLRECWESYVNG
jgi:hypothetical protein